MSMDKDRKVSFRDVVMRACIIIMVFFMVTIMVRFFTRQILVKRLGMDNAWTRFVLSGTELGEADVDIDIDWQALYPFEEGESPEMRKAVEWPLSYVQRLGAIEEKVIDLEGKIGVYASDLLVGYQTLVEVEKGYESAIGWNLVAYEEYNGVIKLPDGQLTSLVQRMEVSENVNALAELDSFCKEQDIDFLYVQAPHKISKFEDVGISGNTDFSNQNADDLLKGLEENGVGYYDLRDEIRKQNLDHHALFYRTDHHWKAETGLWAAGLLAQKLEEEYGIHIDHSLFGEENYKFVEYEDWFLGSYGKKVTLAQTAPDDFSLIYPKFTTELELKIPSKSIDVVGDFSVIYDMKQVKKRNYYRLNPYGAYIYGDKPLTLFHNLNTENGSKVLVIKDSFALCVAPFLALGVEYTDVLDLRHFDGSVRAYIAEAKPDIVIVFYNPDQTKEIDPASHKSTFDFR